VSGCAGLGIVETDEAGKQRTACSDGLGRLTHLVQGDGNTAVYTYDAQDSLQTVTFAGQVRRFEYRLGRMVKACNPESVPDGIDQPAAVSCSSSPLPATGVDVYEYDNTTGNLTKHTNARDVSTTYGYDSLNRLTTRTYSDGTPQATYTYDTAYKGALSTASAGGNSTAYGFDGWGRVTSSRQTTGGVTYPQITYEYSLADQLTAMTYPSGRRVAYALDGAGRVSSVIGIAGGASTNYATGLQYGPHGGLTTMSLGSGVAESYRWNDRLQLTRMTAGSLLDLGFSYCDNGNANCPGNNGTMRLQTITLPGVSPVTQYFRYDAVNRLLGAAENQSANDCSSGGVWCQQYLYDLAGNRTTGARYGDVHSQWEVAGFRSATNRINAPNWAYDATGNIVKTAFNATIAYDGENRQVAYCTVDPSGCVNTAGPGRTRYVYDAEGRRVQRLDPVGSPTTYVYDAFGDVAAEYGPDGAVGTQYLTTDHLGSTRLTTTSGAVERHDYFPWGDEVPAGGWRTSALGYVAGTVRQRFTGEYRDTESALDYLPGNRRGRR
jgi:YD repeat-containing protein